MSRGRASGRNELKTLVTHRVVSHPSAFIPRSDAAWPYTHSVLPRPLTVRETLVRGSRGRARVTSAFFCTFARYALVFLDLTALCHQVSSAVAPLRERNRVYVRSSRALSSFPDRSAARTRSGANLVTLAPPAFETVNDVSLAVHSPRDPAFAVSMPSFVLAARDANFSRSDAVRYGVVARRPLRGGSVSRRATDSRRASRLG